MNTNTAIKELQDLSAVVASGILDDVPSNVSVVPYDALKGNAFVRPPGYLYHNQHGMGFRINSYAKFGFLRSPARTDKADAIAFHGDKPPLCVLPVVRQVHPSPRLARLYKEVDAVTPKELVVADAAGLPERNRQIMEGIHFTSWREIPNIAAIVVDSNVCREDIVAHELMHIWLDLVEGYEDHRRYRDLSNGRNSYALLSTQSYVIDCKVQEKLRERGFPLRAFSVDVVEALYDSAVAYEAGQRLRNPFQESILAKVLARPWTVPELYDFTSEDWGKISWAKETFRRHVPPVVHLADRFIRAFNEHSYSTISDATRLIDECLKLEFDYLGEDFDVKCDLDVERDWVEYRDKFPHYLPGLPPKLKHDVIRQMLREDRPIGTQITTRWTDDGRLAVRLDPPPGYLDGVSDSGQ